MEVVFFSRSLVLSLSRFHESPLCSLLRHISFFFLPQGLFMARSWRRGSVFSPPPSVFPPSILPFHSHWWRRMGKEWRPGRRTPSPRSFSADSGRPTTTTPVSLGHKDRGPKRWPRSSTHDLYNGLWLTVDWLRGLWSHKYASCAAVLHIEEVTHYLFFTVVPSSC